MSRKFITEDGREYDSFLECVSQEKFSVHDLDHESILHFLTFGAFYFNKTALKGVRKSFSHQQLTLKSGVGLTKKQDEHDTALIEYPVEKPVEHFLEFFEDLAPHLRDKKITVDLTGGIDSRLVATALHFFEVPIEAVFSLDSGDEGEAKLVKRVAKCLNVDLQILKSDEITSDKSLEDLFLLSDGLWDVLKLKSMRNTQSWRKEQGYELIITGVGGELYKDFFWQQDFPFYSKKDSNLKRLVDSRMYPHYLNPDWLGQNLKKYSNDLKANFLNKLSKYLRETNTQTYDQIYYNVRIKEHLSVFSNATSRNFMDVYTPLLEDELLKIGYNLPRTMRFFNNFHRKVITILNSEVAQIPTTEGGISCSSKPLDITKDLSAYIQQKSQKVLTRVFGSDSENEDCLSDKNNYLEERIEESVILLKENQILSDAFPEANEDIPSSLKGRLLTLGMLINRIQ